MFLSLPESLSLENMVQPKYIYVVCYGMDTSQHHVAVVAKE